MNQRIKVVGFEKKLDNSEHILTFHLKNGAIITGSDTGWSYKKISISCIGGDLYDFPDSGISEVLRPLTKYKLLSNTMVVVTDNQIELYVYRKSDEEKLKAN